MNLKITAPNKSVIYCFLLLLATSGCKDNQNTISTSDKPTDKTFPVEITKPFYEEVSHTLEAVGSFFPENEITIGAKVAGTIKILYADEGSIVKKGGMLMEIDDEKFRLEAEETNAMLKEAVAKLKNARATFNRINRLYQDGIIGRDEFDDAETQVSLNQSVVEELSARLNLSKKSVRDTKVLSPLDGVVSERIVSAGEYVKVAAQLMKVVDLTPLKLVFNLPEKDIAAVRQGLKVNITTRAYPGETFNGKIYFINPKADANTRTIEVKAWVDNSDYKLKPGFFVNVTVFTGAKKAFLLPESAVVVRKGSFVAMAVENNRIKYKKVTPGIRFDGKVEILHGISADDYIVVYGRSEISEGTPVKVINASDT